MMEFRILGPLEALSGGEPIDLGPHKQRAVLALLLLDVGRVVSTDRILEELWGNDAAGREKALWVHISRLRSALEPQRTERGQSSVLVTRDHGYMICADPASVDARRFEAAVGEAGARLKDDPAAAAEILRTALDLWRGSALQDFAYDEFARTEIMRLEELRVGAVEIRIDADLRRGLAAELIGELESLVEQQPHRERPVAQLMHACYRAGRQAEGLRAFRRFRHRIGEELGIEPSPELCRLEEQILLHDPRLAPVASRVSATASTNPFKGLRPFHESDVDDFFGRDRLVAEVVDRIAGRCRLVALVGPSGSGKSSVVGAGVVPALRNGAVPGSERWLVASMVPGTHPFAELEAALLRSTIDAPISLDAQLADPSLGLLRAALRLVPDDSRLVLVIDQFEEIFTLVDEKVGQRFLVNLVAAIDDPQGRVVVVLTLRADSYHRLLAQSDLAARLGPGVVNVVPLSTDELEEAAQEPAARRGVTIEPLLLAELLVDVTGEPGGLPLFQYALTDLFDRRDGDQLTLAAYRSMGGIRGALSRRAGDVYDRLNLDEQDAARQLFLRLVTIAEHDQWSRRRVPASEIVTMDVDVVTMESVIGQFGRRRFLAFDRDHGSGAPTVEVAHEALLSEWDRLRGWIEEARVDITRRTALDAALAEWSGAGQDRDYLIGGKRLAEYDQWRETTTLRLTTAEREFLDASLARRDEAMAAEQARVAREASTARRARRRWWALVGVLAVLAAAGTAEFVFGPTPPPDVSLLLWDVEQGTNDDLFADGLDRAVREFGVEPTVLTGPFANLDDEFASLATSGTELVLITDAVFYQEAYEAAAKYPGTTWAYVDPPIDVTPSITFAEQEGSYLAGAAAALTSQTKTIAFVGGNQFPSIESFRAGFEAGAWSVDPAIEILAAYTSLDGNGFISEDLAHEVATGMYQRGADVIYHAAGAADAGVFAAAREESEIQDRHLWAIGVDSDQYLDVPAAERPHVLTSMIKRMDVAVYELISDFLDGDLDDTNRELTLSDGGVGYSTTGGNLTQTTIAELERLEREIIAGTRTVPRSPTGALEPPPNATIDHTITVTFDGTTCRVDGLAPYDVGDVVRIDVVNDTRRDAVFRVEHNDTWAVGIAVPASGTSMGYASMYWAGHYTTRCAPEPTNGAVQTPGPAFDVPSA